MSTNEFNRWRDCYTYAKTPPPAEASGGVSLGGVLSQITTLTTTRT